MTIHQDRAGMPERHNRPHQGHKEKPMPTTTEDTRQQVTETHPCVECRVIANAESMVQLLCCNTYACDNHSCACPVEEKE